MKADVIHVNHVVIQSVADMSNFILTSECEECLHSELNETNPAKIMVYCRIKEKWYIYGKCIPCEFKEKKRND